MRVMVIVKADKESEAGKLPDQKLMSDMTAFNEELSKAGLLLAGEGLRPSSRGARVRFDGTKRAVVDGPFSETKELVGGFWLWKVNSMEQALEWAKRVPFDRGEIEIRQVAELEDFGDAYPAELRARDQKAFEDAAAHRDS